MTIRVELPADVVDEIVAAVTQRVLDRLSAQSDNRADPPSPYLTIPETAAYLRCSRQRVDDLLSQRRLTRVKEGARTLIRRDEVEAHLTTEGRCR